MIDSQIAIAVIGSITAIVLAYLKLQGEIRATHKLVNSRMDELLELTRVAALAAGRLDAVESRKHSLDVPGVVKHVEQAPHRAHVEP